MNAPYPCSQSRLTRRFVRVLLALVMTATGASLLRAQTTAIEPENHSPLAYRRVFVPAERTADWPTEGAQYLPMERAEFERLVQQSTERRQLQRPGLARVTSADYVARLTETDSLAGVATFDVRAIENSPTLLPLAPWNAVVLRGRWLAAAPDAEPTPAEIGLWLDDEGQPATYGLLVDRSGQVAFDWRAAPSQRGGKLEFSLNLPIAVAQTLTLELPADATPTISSGQLVDQSPAPQGAMRNWTFQLAAGSEHRLTIRRQEAAPSAASSADLPLAAMTEAYHLTADGVDYEAELRIQSRGALPAELRLAAPPSLHVASVAVNRSPVQWRRDPEDAAALLVALPTPGSVPTGAPLIVAVSGAAPVTCDAPWTLPGIMPQGLSWTEGTSTLWVDPALEIRSLTPRECSLLNVVGVGSGAAGEVYRLQAWSRAAAVDLIVGDRREILRRRSGVVTEFADREIIARAQIVLWAEEGRVFRVTAPLANDWNIESIVAEPADAIAEWHVEEGEARKLHLQLRRSPTAAAPLSLTVAARKPWRSWTRMAPLSDLNFLQLPGGSDGQWLLAKDRRGKEIVPDVKLAEATVAADALPPGAQDLLGKVDGGLLIDLSEANPAAIVSVASTPVAFQAEAWLDVTAGGAGYEHRAEILCRPVSGAISELRLLAARPLPADVVWQLDDGQPLAVERAAAPSSPPPSAAPPAATSAEYRVRLPQPRTVPFRIRAVWRSNLPADAAVNVVSLPDAETWQAWAILRGHAGQVAVDPRGAASAFALPSRDPSLDGQLPALACYRLGDDPATFPSTPPTFVSRAAGDAALTGGVVAWRCDAETQQFSDGTQNHRLAYQIEARQPADVELTVPAGIAYTTITLDGRSLIAARGPDARSVTLRIPASAQRQTLTVALEGKISPLGRTSKVEPVLPRASFPVLRGEWTLRWPAAYNAELLGPQRQHFGAPPADWLARLGGPLSGRGDQRWYDGMLLAHVDAASPVIPASAVGVAAPGGWSILTQTFVDRPEPVELRLASAVQANWHVAWLTAAVASAWLWARSRRAVVLLTAAAAALCLAVPDAYIPLPQATFLGLLTGAFVRQFVSFLTKSRAGVRPRSSAAVAILITAVGSATVTFMPSQSFAQGSPPTPTLAETAAPASASPLVPAPAKAPPQVLFPVDDAGQPSGSDVYVPAPLAAQLLSATGGAPAALVDARYQIELQPAGADGELVPRRVQLRFGWHSRRSQTRVELPLAAAGMLDPASLLLDGQPILPAWSADGTALLVTLAQPGAHELTAALTPLATSSAVGESQRARLQLRVPSLAGSTVEVLHPAGLADVQVAAADLAPAQSSAVRTTFHLGPADLLDVTWPARLPREAAGVTVEQLSLLEVDPAAARLEVRLRLSGDAAPLETLRVAASPQLKLLPLPEGSPLEVAPPALAEPAAAVTTSFRFRSKPTWPVVLSLQYQLQRTLSVGCIDYPWVKPLGVNVRSRHFAVAADPRLRVRDGAAGGLTPVTLAELETLWGPAAADASLHYVVAADAPDWSLDVAPAAARFTSRDSLELHCGETDVRVAYAAAISEVDGELLVHRLVVSPDLQIERVATTLDGADAALPLRWARPQPDQLHVFLSRPLSDPHTLRVEGRLHEAVTAAPAGAAADAGVLPAGQRTVQVPHIALESSPAAPVDVSLFRSGDVLVAWASAAPPLKPSANSVDPAKGLLVGQFAIQRNAASPPELRITRNDAQYEADALLTLQLEAAEPTAECRLEGRATRGMVDRLRLIVGKNWRGPLTVEPAARIERRDIAADADRQTLDVRLERAIPAGEAFRVVIRGPVSLESDQRIRFPALRLANAQRQRLFLILPPTTGNLTPEWTLRGVQAQPLPEALAAGLDAAPAPAYRVLRERFVAEQRVFPDAIRSPAYRLAEIHMVVDADGSATALAQLVVQAGGGDQCQVTFPAGAQVQYVAVDGIPQHQLPAAALWNAPVASRFLPRVFQFSYRLPKFAAAAERQFTPPQVAVDGKLLAPQRALWQIADAAAQPMPSDRSRLMTAGELAAAARRAQIEAFLDAYPLASQLAEWELKQWRQPWLDRFSVADPASAASDPAAWTRLRERLAAADAPTSASADAATEPESFWSDSASAISIAGDAAGAVLLVPRTTPWPIARWFAAAMLAAAVGIAWRQPAALRSLTFPMQRWPYIALGAAGLMWWAFLAPSLLGLVIIAFAIAAYRKSRR